LRSRFTTSTAAAADRCNLAFQIPHTRFLRIVADDSEQGIVGCFEIRIVQAVRLALLLHQVALRNVRFSISV
jgi:hypothetical protein